MSETENCPSEKMLIDFAAQTLNGDDTAVVLDHLEECQTCAEAVEWIKCHLLRPIDDDESELTGIGLNSPAEEDPTSVSDAGEQNPQLVDFDFSSLQKSIVDGAIGRLGSYDILGIIGRGGMGVVFKAWDERLRRTVAIKVLKRTLACSSASRRRFLREARAAAAISHPNVVTIHAVDEHRDIPFIVMEYVNGHSLRSAIRSGSRLAFTTVLRISAQVASGLSGAHGHGVIHRDIKPSNIMLEEKVDRAKITDFGLARAAFDRTDLTSCELAIGTPAYMSPEQVTGNTVDCRSDLFGLGCLFFEMVIGHSPFQGRNALDVARKVEIHTPQPLHVLDPNVPRFYSDLVARLLEKEPDNRFQSAAEVADILTGQLHSINQMPSGYVPILGPSRNDLNQKPRPRLHPLMVSAALILLVLAMSGVAIFAPGLLTKNLIAQNPGDPELQIASAAAISSPANLELRVAKSGGAMYSTIQSALQKARRNCTIVILDDATYEETLIINDSERWEGLTIRSPKAATLRCDTQETLLTVDAVSHVTVSGLRFEAYADQHAIEIDGECTGTTFHDLTVQLPRQSQLPAIILNTTPTGTKDEPIVIKHCVVLANHGIAVVGERRYPATWIRINGNRFEGFGTNRNGAGVLLDNRVDHLVVEQNIFFALRRAISVAPDKGNVGAIQIRKNTIYDCKNWFSIVGPASHPGRLEVSDNLLAQVEGVEMPEQILKFTATCFANNRWEVKGSDEAVDRSRAEKVAELCEEISFRSRDPQSDEFLKPADVARPGSSTAPSREAR